MECAHQTPRKERKPKTRAEGEAEPRRIPLRGEEKEHDDSRKGERFEAVRLSPERFGSAEHAAHQHGAEGGHREPAEGTIQKGERERREKGKPPYSSEKQHRRAEQHADMQPRDGEDMRDAALSHRLFEFPFDGARIAREKRVGKRGFIPPHVRIQHFIELSVEAQNKIAALRRRDEFARGRRIADIGSEVVLGIGALFEGIVLFGFAPKDDEIARKYAVGRQNGAAFARRLLSVQREVFEDGDGVPLPFRNGKDSRRHRVFPRRKPFFIIGKSKLHEPDADPREHGHDEKER